MSDLKKKTNNSEEDFSEIKKLKFKIIELEDREKNSLLDIKSKFSEVYQKFKEEMNKKIELKNQKISKLKLIIAEMESEIKRITYISDERHNKEKSELETVIIKQEELIENLYQKNENFIKTISCKNKELNTLRMKLKNEELLDWKNKVLENQSINSSAVNILLKSKNLRSNNIKINDKFEGEINENRGNKKISEVEYFKNLNKNLLDQIRSSEGIMKNYEKKISQMSEELDELKKLRQKFEKFEHSYIQNFKNNEIINEIGEKTLNLENTVNEDQTNNIQHILHTENNEFKLNMTNKNYNEGGISVVIENDEKNVNSKNETENSKLKNNEISKINLNENDNQSLIGQSVSNNNMNYLKNFNINIGERINQEDKNENIDSRNKLSKIAIFSNEKNTKISKNEIYGKSFIDKEVLDKNDIKTSITIEKSDKDKIIEDNN